MTANISIYTPFNTRPVRSNVDTRRVLNPKTGRWERQEPKAANLLRWLKSSN